MKLLERAIISDKLVELIHDLNGIDQQLLIDFPITEYHETIKALPSTTCYAFIPEDLRERIAQINQRYGQGAVAVYQKATLAFCIQNSLSVFQDDRLPADVKSFYAQRFNLILDDFDNQPNDYYDYSNDFFLKDLNICSLKLIPAGGQLVQLSLLNWYFILRSIRYGGLNQGSLSKFIETSRFYLTGIKRDLPFYEKHLDTRWLHEFNRAGRHRFHLRIAEMLKLNPHIQGLFGVSWFYDPSLEEISPGLLYLRKIPEQGGAKVFKFGTTPSDIKHAIVASQRREQLYKEGQYQPTAYVLVWLRDDLIKWANEVTTSNQALKSGEMLRA